MRYNSKQIIHIIFFTIIASGLGIFIYKHSSFSVLFLFFSILIIYSIILYLQQKKGIINNRKNDLLYSYLLNSQDKTTSILIKKNGTVKKVLNSKTSLNIIEFKTILEFPDNEIEKEEINTFLNEIWLSNSSKITIHKNEAVFELKGTNIPELKERAIVTITDITSIDNQAKVAEIIFAKHKRLEKESLKTKTLNNDFSKILNKYEGLCIIFNITTLGLLNEIIFINENAKRELNHIESSNNINNKTFLETEFYQKLASHNFIENSLFEDKYINESEIIFKAEAKYNFDTSSVILIITKSSKDINEEPKNNIDLVISNFKNSVDGAMIFDTKGSISFINNAMAEVLKLENVNNTISILDYINKTGDIDSSNYIVEVINKAKSTITPIFKLKNDNTSYISTFQPLFNKLGKVQHILRLTYKITDDSYRDFNYDTSLSFENILRTNILSNFSHEIRTSMNSILGTADILESYSTNKEEQEYISLIRRSGEDVHALLESFKLFTLLNNKSLLPTIVNFTLNDLIESIKTEITYIKERFSKQNLDINFLVLPEMLQFRIKNDKENISNILIKLIENAIKYTDEGYVNIGFNTFNKKQLTIWVEDSGVGISKTIMPTIFIPFSSINPVNNSSAGLGIGLTIAKELTELIGGNIEVESSVGKGSKFLINIPIGNTKGEIDTINNSKIKILIVQYGYVFDKDLKRYLKQKEITVFNTNKGSDAIEIVSENKDISIVFTDINHTDITGLELAKALVRISPNIIIIAQAPYFILEEKIKLLNNGFNDYLVKPVFSTQFIKTIEKFMPEITN